MVQITIQQVVLETIQNQARNNKVRKNELCKKIAYFRLSKKDIEEILREMVKEGIIEQDKDYVMLK